MFWIGSHARLMTCRFFLPFHGEPSHFPDGVRGGTGVFHFAEVQFLESPFKKPLLNLRSWGSSKSFVALALTFC